MRVTDVPVIDRLTNRPLAELEEALTGLGNALMDSCDGCAEWGLVLHSRAVGALETVLPDARV